MSEAKETLRRRPGRRPTGEGSAEDTRSAIFQAALSLFNERGYNSVSMVDIAGAAGVTKATLYYHFSGKPEALTSSILNIADKLYAETAALTEQKDQSVAERLRHLTAGERRREAFFFNPVMMEEAMRRLSQEQRESLESAFMRLHLPVRELMAEGVASGELRPTDPDVLAVAFLRLFEPHTYHELAGKDLETFDREILELFLHGALA